MSSHLASRWALLIVLAGGVPGDNSLAADLEFTAPPLPVIELPEIDLAKAETEARDQADPPPIDIKIPRCEFLVRFEARVDPREKAPGGGIFYVHMRHPKGVAVLTGGHVLATAQSNDKIKVYEGKIRKPGRSGPAIIEIRLKNKSYLVRATVVE